MTIDPSERFAVSCDIVSREVGGEFILLNLASGTYFGLNAVGTRIWHLVREDACSLDEIRDAIMAEFDVGRAEAERDIHDLASAMLERGLLVRAA
ncbi:PqqD family protein [Novosphingobium sp. ZN18A2]|uniref:PqqD family protein n=1 Tax=Novosphingobium sp. ZN18A2 TaxID=3079861 RepID=UPI0030CB3B93